MDQFAREMGARLARALPGERREQLLALLMELLEAEPLFDSAYVREFVSTLAAAPAS